MGLIGGAIRGLILIVLLLATACGSDGPSALTAQQPGEVTLTANASRYAPGDSPRLTLHNGTEGDVGYNLCFGFIELERNEAGSWTKISAYLGPRPNTACTAPLYLLKPDTSATGEVRLPADLPSGTYRLVHRVEIEGIRQPIATGAFEVAA